MGVFALRELHKKDYPILWDGHLAHPCIISGQDARTTRNFGIFFWLEVSKYNLNKLSEDLRTNHRIISHITISMKPNKAKNG
jgi:hypothetical protein